MKHPFRFSFALLGLLLLLSDCASPNPPTPPSPPPSAPPAVEIRKNWDQAYYKAERFQHPGNWLPQAFSGDEWFYDTKTYPVGNSYEIVTAGYTSYLNYYYDDNSGCLSEAGGNPNEQDFEMAGYERGSYLLNLCKITPGVPTPIHNATYGLVGELHSVIKTADGGYAATGFSRSCKFIAQDDEYLPLPRKFAYQDFLGYNPSSNSCAQGSCGRFENWNGYFDPRIKNVNHMIVLRTDANLELQWAYLYGLANYNASGMLIKNYKGNQITKVLPQAGLAWLCSSAGFDIEELPNGHFLVGGRADDPNYSFNNYPATADQDCHWFGGDPWGHVAIGRGMLMEIDDRGSMQWRKAIGPTDRHSTLAGIVKTTQPGLPPYIIAGEEQDEHHMFTIQGNAPANCKEKIRHFRAFAAGVDASGTELWRKNFGDHPGDPDPDFPGTFFHQSVQMRDLAIDVNDRILLPVIENGRTHDGGRWGLTDGNSGVGDAVVYVFDPASGNTMIPPVQLGEVTAFDCQMGVTGLADGGFAAVSSRQAGGVPFYKDQSGGSAWPNITDYKTFYWGTDAYVMRCNAAGEVIWQCDFPYADGLAPPYASGTSPEPQNWLFPPDADYQTFLLSQGMPDFKRQECLYKISQATGDKLVIGGNSSENLDDNLAMEIQDGDFIELDGRVIHSEADFTAPDYVRVRDVRIRGCTPIQVLTTNFTQCGVSTMKACDFVDLQPGFHAEAGSRFVAQAGYCPVK